MIPVNQTVIDFGRGNCLSACLASIMELPIEEVPNFREKAGVEGDMVGFINKWLAPLGLHYFAVDMLAGCGTWHSLDTYCVFSVPSQMNEKGTHAVVGKFERVWHEDRKTWGVHWSIVHDPNPNNKPYDADDIFRVGFLVWRGTRG